LLITQKELAEMIDCAPVTVQSIELGKLRLSQKLAKRIELQTGVSLEWLLQNDYAVPPTCRMEPGQPYTKRIYQMTRAEITDPRTDSADLIIAQGVLDSAGDQLASRSVAGHSGDGVYPRRVGACGAAETRCERGPHHSEQTRRERKVRFCVAAALDWFR